MPEDWDGVYKRLFRDFPQSSLRILCGIDASTAVVTPLPTEFALKPRADIVCEVQRSGGDAVVVHVEVQTTPADDLELRMVGYRAALTRTHGRPPHQVVLLPRGGPYTGTYALGRLTLGYDVVDVTALDPEVLRHSPLMPLVLRPGASEELVNDVVTRIAASADDVDARATLGDLAMLGADDELAQLITDSVLRSAMSDVLERTSAGRALIAQGEARGASRGRVEADADALRVLLADRFGDSAELGPLSLALAQQGFASAYPRVKQATSLADLRD